MMFFWQICAAIGLASLVCTSSLLTCIAWGLLVRPRLDAWFRLSVRVRP
jgi:hypothetical protein